MAHFVYEPGTEPLHYDIFKEFEAFSVRVRTTGIARYPVQLFEATSTLLLFVFLFWYWNKYKLTLCDGRIFGISMIVFWGLRFLYEFLKENQESFIKGLGLNKAQVLCVPLILIGVAVLFISYRKPVELNGK
jgi:phosphatidylglycerol---prolipoprotein diacylglyceryl transferase